MLFLYMHLRIPEQKESHINIYRVQARYKAKWTIKKWELYKQKIRYKLVTMDFQGIGIGDKIHRKVR